MQRLNKKKTLLNNSDGSAVVEATFVFPIMFMVFFALVLLAIYLPQRAMLQRATQYAATAIATEMSDTWIYYNESGHTLERYANHKDLQRGKGGVYVTLFNSAFGASTDGGEAIVKHLDTTENIPLVANGSLSVACELVNYVVYKEVVITATRLIPVPVDFSAIQFPNTIELVVTSKAVVQNGDEFVRNIDIAVDFVDWARKKFPAIDNVFKTINEAGDKISGFFGI